MMVSGWLTSWLMTISGWWLLLALLNDGWWWFMNGQGWWLIVDGCFSWFSNACYQWLMVLFVLLDYKSWSMSSRRLINWWLITVSVGWQGIAIKVAKEYEYTSLHTLLLWDWWRTIGGKTRLTWFDHNSLPLMLVIWAAFVHRWCLNHGIHCMIAWKVNTYQRLFTYTDHK